LGLQRENPLSKEVLPARVSEAGEEERGGLAKNKKLEWSWCAQNKRGSEKIREKRGPTFGRVEFMEKNNRKICAEGRNESPGAD